MFLWYLLKGENVLFILSGDNKDGIWRCLVWEIIIWYVGWFEYSLLKVLLIRRNGVVVYW